MSGNVAPQFRYCWTHFWSTFWSSNYAYDISFQSLGSQESTASNGMRFGGEMKKLWSFEDKRAKLSENFAAAKSFWSCDTAAKSPLSCEITFELRNDYEMISKLRNGCEIISKLRNGCEISSKLRNGLQIAKLTCKMEVRHFRSWFAQSSSNGHNFSVSNPNQVTFEAVDSWLPKLSNEILHA